MEDVRRYTVFGKFYGTFVYFQVIWYIFPRFGMLKQVKSGNTYVRVTRLGYFSPIGWLFTFGRYVVFL
jgi:hypothetical protein